MDCPKCGKHIGRKEKLKLRLMEQASKGLITDPLVLEKLNSMDETISLDIASFRQHKGWCMDCIIAARETATPEPSRTCPNCGEAISTTQDNELKKLRRSLSAETLIRQEGRMENLGRVQRWAAQKKMKALDDHLNGKGSLILELVEQGFCAKCITEKCGKEF